MTYLDGLIVDLFNLAVALCGIVVFAGGCTISGIWLWWNCVGKRRRRR